MPARISSTTISVTTTPFARAKVDWQIWITTGSKPLPRKVVITNRADEARPQSVSPDRLEPEADLQGLGVQVHAAQGRTFDRDSFRRRPSKGAPDMNRSFGKLVSASFAALVLASFAMASVAEAAAGVAVVAAVVAAGAVPVRSGGGGGGGRRCPCQRRRRRRRQAERAGQQQPGRCAHQRCPQHQRQ